jgi:hypothetical protein
MKKLEFNEKLAIVITVLAVIANIFIIANVIHHW